MSMLCLRLVRNLAILLFVGAAVPAAWGQYPYPYPPPPYYPPPGYGGFGPGNVLNGSANVINAQGNLINQQEQARIEREKVNQAKLETKKKTLDWLNYERANTWTFTDEQARNKSILLRRMLANPASGEITSGLAQNTLLPYLEQLTYKGIQGPPVPLDQGQVRQLNVTTKGGGGNVGLLRDGGKVTWPLALRGPKQEKLNELLPLAVSQTIKGTLSYQTFKQLRGGIDELTQDLKNGYYQDQIDAGSYLIGKNFLDDLRQAVGMLQKPAAAKLLDGTFAARGRTVPELVQQMTGQGLEFAPALSGTEPAYFGLQNAFTVYAAGAQSSPGFQVRGMPAPLQGPGRGPTP
jgi:hypothetical protein